jgi:hypothetical protein
MPSFTFPSMILNYLSRLTLASDLDKDSLMLTCVGVSVQPGRARFACTDGKLLAVVSCIAAEVSDPIEVALAGEQFTDAMKTLIRNLPRGSHPDLTATVEGKSVRFNLGLTAVVVRVVEGNYPNYSGAFAKHLGSTMIPSNGHFNPKHLSIMQKIVGKEKNVLLFSPETPPGKPDSFYSLPGFFCHNGLGMLLMQIARTDEAHDYDLSLFTETQMKTVEIQSTEKKET